MNPLVIAGVLAVTIVSFYMMVSFSDSQVQYSGVSEKISSMQVQRLHEEISGTIQDGQLYLENTGTVPVRIKEIRILSDSGHVTSVHATDLDMSIRQTNSVSLDLLGVTP